MLTRETVLASMKEGLGQAVKDATWTEDGRLEEILFPFWSDSVHGLLMQEGACCCRSSRPDKCFAVLPKERRLQLVGAGIMSFDSFIRLFREAREEFHSFLTQFSEPPNN